MGEGALAGGLAVPWSTGATNWRPLGAGVLCSRVCSSLLVLPCTWIFTVTAEVTLEARRRIRPLNAKTARFGKRQTWVWILSLPLLGFMKSGTWASALSSVRCKGEPRVSGGCWGLSEPAGQGNAPQRDSSTLRNQILPNAVIFLYSLPHFYNSWIKQYGA